MDPSAALQLPQVSIFAFDIRDEVLACVTPCSCSRLWRVTKYCGFGVRRLKRVRIFKHARTLAHPLWQCSHANPVQRRS